MTAPTDTFRALSFRAHSIRPTAGDGIAFVEATIEEQLSRLLDGHPLDEALTLLREWNPALEQELIVSLLDVADEVAVAAANGRPDFYRLVDEHAWALHTLAVKARAVSA